MRKTIAGMCLTLFAGITLGQQVPRSATTPATPDALQAEIEALRASKVAWREIAWKSCLLDGLTESRARGKPALLWVFIDRPSDDARC
ncbi:MAG TPA: hypothetical protein VKU82_02310 [Planctomycetaceae bacterium]|nr:hypothetical protein [Planctomycetaceae bacterium]